MFCQRDRLYADSGLERRADKRPAYTIQSNICVVQQFIEFDRGIIVIVRSNALSSRVSYENLSGYIFFLVVSWKRCACICAWTEGLLVSRPWRRGARLLTEAAGYPATPSAPLLSCAFRAVLRALMPSEAQPRSAAPNMANRSLINVVWHFFPFSLPFSFVVLHLGSNAPILPCTRTCFLLVMNTSWSSSVISSAFHGWKQSGILKTDYIFWGA